MVGELDALVAQSATFITTRWDPSDPARPVTVDDASAALARFVGGQRGVFEFAKICHGRPTDFSIEVNGRDGTLLFNYNHLNELWFASARDEPSEYGIRKIRAEHRSQPYAANWWPPRSAWATRRASSISSATCWSFGPTGRGDPT